MSFELDIANNGEASSGPVPTSFAVIIGAMKSGTTTLFRLLAQHPEIARPSNKEPEFFSIDAKWDQGIESYQGLWNWDTDRHKVALEASTGYTKYPFEKNVPERMASLKGTEFRFIYLVRNPFERIESHIRQGIHSGWNEDLDNGFDASSYPIQITRYANQLDRFLEHFPRSSLFVGALDDLNKDPAGFLRLVCDHLGVDPDFQFKGMDQMANPGSRYRRKGWINRLEENQSVPLRIGKRALKGVLGAKRLDAMLNGRAAQVDLGRYQLTAGERARVVEYIGQDLKRLRDEFGIDAKELWGIDV